MIEINHLVKRYGENDAVKDLTFRVEKGQIYGFLGPNGAGKSTTMNIITGYLAATSGEVKINGYDIVKEPEKARRSIGYLPELPPLYPEMTVEEYLRFAAELKKIPAKERTSCIEEAMRLAQIGDVRKRLIHNLSKGYKQRVGLAQAVLGNPEVIILDEPTVGLDPKQMIEIRELILKLREKHTVILSSHILSEVSAVCDQILIISKGRLVACDTPEGLQRMLEGGAEYAYTLKTNPKTLQALLQQASAEEGAGMEWRVEKTGGKGSGRTESDYPGVRLIVKETEAGNVRERLFAVLAQAGIPILELSSCQKSLEDIFLELTEAKPEEGKERRKKTLFKKKTPQIRASQETVSAEAGNEEVADNDSNL